MSAAKISLPYPVVLRMIADYVRVRLGRQLRSASFIVAYLIAFQLLVFGSAPDQALRVACGIAMVVVGLTLFLEGLFLGLMPLAERVGIQLPARGGLRLIIPIGLLVGLASTLAEPALAALRVVGADIAAWEAPLLFYMLQRHPELLIVAIGVGVGAAVAIGMIRFHVGFSIKPVILITIPILLVLSFVCSQSEGLVGILALAWDAGAVTTGPVTVPLVLALGIGVARSSGRGEGAGSGFGVVMLASALPVLAVMMLGVFLLPYVPAPSSEEAFFAPTNREQAMRLFADEDELRAHAFSHGSEAAHKAFEMDELEDGNPPSANRVVDTGAMPHTVATTLLREVVQAVRAILPLTFLLAIVLSCVRDRPRYLDEVLLGILFSLVGMSLLTTGIQTGLSPLGRQTGSRLPQVYRDVEVDRGQIVIQDFDPAVVFSAVTPDEGTIEVFHLHDGATVQTVRFKPEWYDPDRRVYTHRIRVSPLTHPGLTRIGIVLILLFAFGMGYGTTIVEPALNALGSTVEDLSVGTIKGAAVVRAVSIGVGLGLIVGVIRMLFNIPMIWMILPPYLLLLPLTLLSEEDFAGIAWDSGGVTTGPVTVPLVLAMGFGLGGQLEIVDVFGILAMASAYPIVTVLVFGLVVRMGRRRVVRSTEGADRLG